MHENKVSEDSKFKTFYERPNIRSEFEIVSSADHAYAISDAVQDFLNQTRKSLFISAPWLGKGFIGKVRNLPKGVEIKLLTRVPDEDDYRTYRTLEAFEEIAKSKGFKLKIMCRQYLHLKLCISDHKIVLSGSPNPTNYGENYNDELLYEFKDPVVVERHIAIFNKHWYSPRNMTWENVQRYHGRRGYHKPNYKEIARAITGYFHIFGKKEVRKSVLYEELAKEMKFNKSDVIEVVKNLLNDGILYEPKPDYIRLIG